MNKYLTLADAAIIPNGFVKGMTKNVELGDIHGALLRTGRVVKAYPPADKQSEPEYDVVVDDFSPHGVANRYTMYRCKVANLFGGTADYSFWTPRVTDIADKKNEQSDESRVLVLCLNGQIYHGNGIIVGSVNHPNYKFQKDEGHQYVWQFNGVRQTVDNDGQYTLSFKGATDIKGNLTDKADSKASGSTLTFTKDGSIKLHTAGSAQYIHANHDSKVIDVLADTDFKVTSNGTANVTAAKDVKVTSSEGAMAFKAAKLITTTSAGVHHGNATDAMLMGTTYRTQEQTLHNQITAAMTTIATALTAAGAALTAASAAHATPVVGPIVGAPALATAATQLITAATSALQVQAAITAFEAAAPTYLSKKNKLD